MCNYVKNKKGLSFSFAILTILFFALKILVTKA